MANDSGKNVVVADQLEALAIVAKNYTLAEIANSGGGSGVTNATVFTGATGITGGQSSLVPAPNAGDNEKFLRGDGQWVTLSGGGESYSIATSSQAGLMSAEDKQHLDAVFQSSADLTDAVVTVVGGKFVPSVDSLPDFITYKDSNVTFLDNKLKKIIEGSSTRDPIHIGSWYQFGTIHLYIDSDNGKDSLCSSAGNKVTIGTYSDTLWTDYQIYQLSETAGFIIRSAEAIRNDYSRYTSAYCLRGFNVSEYGTVSLQSNCTITGAASSVASANAWKNINFCGSISDPCNFLFMTNACANDNYTYSYNTFYVRASDGTTASLQATVTIGTDYATSTGKTNIDNIKNAFVRPKITFANGKITITGGASRQYPIWHYKKRIRDSSDSITGGGDYVVIHHGIERGAPANMQLTTISGGVTSTLQPWLEDDDNLIAGVWNAKSDNQIYAVTFKKGTYDFYVDWFDKYSTVWTFDFLTPRIIKTSKKLSEIIDDLQL